MNSKHTFYASLVWIFSAITLIIYGFLSYTNNNIPGIVDLINYVTNIESRFIYIAAAISIFIEGIYAIGSFFPGSSLVMILAIISQSAGLDTFFFTIITIYISWVLAGLLNIYIAKLYRSKIINLEIDHTHIIKNHTWSTWFPAFRANHEVSQVVEGAAPYKVFVSGLYVRMYASICMGLMALLLPLFIDIQNTTSTEGYVSIAIVAAISLFIGISKLWKYIKGTENTKQVNFYQKYILPFALNKTMQGDIFTEIRKEIIPKAIGTVLEIGFGSGLNMPFYKKDGSIGRLYALEPSSELFEKYLSNNGQAKTNPQSLEVNWLKASAESIPLPDASVDTVVSTWTMCSIPNPGVALKEIYRMLRPGGTFIFVEHGLSPHKIVGMCQHIGTPFSKCLAGGCHLNRNIGSILTASPLQIKELKTFSRKYRPLEYTYQGSAVKA